VTITDASWNPRSGNQSSFAALKNTIFFAPLGPRK
jgi:hypothetical protein